MRCSCAQESLLNGHDLYGDSELTDVEDDGNGAGQRRFVLVRHKKVSEFGASLLTFPSVLRMYTICVKLSARLISSASSGKQVLDAVHAYIEYRAAADGQRRNAVGTKRLSRHLDGTRGSSVLFMSYFLCYFLEALVRVA